MPEKVLLSVFRKEKSPGGKPPGDFIKRTETKERMMKRKILTILLAAVVLAIPGCSSDTGKGSGKTAENITIETENGKKTDGKTGEEADEQEAGEMQAAADAIDGVHAEKEEEKSDTAVAQGERSGKKLALDASGDWIRQKSESDGNGGFTETYSCSDRLEYTWNCVSEDSGDAESAAGSYIEENGWTAASVAVNEELTEKLGLDVCEYTAYEDDEGYSMLHRGVVIVENGVYYTADFTMMEGDMGEYEPSVQEWIGQVYVA